MDPTNFLFSDLITSANIFTNKYIATFAREILQRNLTARNFHINSNKIWHAVIKLNLSQRESVQRYRRDAPTARRTFGKQ